LVWKQIRRRKRKMEDTEIRIGESGGEKQKRADRAEK
jgi:hypothetical protein